MKRKVDKKSFMFGFIICLVLLGGISVYAANLISSSDISYDNTSSNLESTNVKDALDELYEISETHCPSGYTCKEKVACTYEVGYYWDFVYTGSVQEFTVPCDGLYKLEVWGGQGGTSNSSASSTAKGGYAIGYKVFESDDNLYIAVGGGTVQAKANYNGGGYASTYDSRDSLNKYSCGGGATHIASTNRGELANYASNTVELYIVAGGAGSGTYYNIAGGNGGGTSGGQGGNSGASGATQTKGYSFGKGGNGSVATRTDAYGYTHNEIGGSGGGGYYGGYAGSGGASGTGGGGGSSYIGGVPELTYNGTTYSPSTTSGVQEGNGKARITLVSY